MVVQALIMNVDCELCNASFVMLIADYGSHATFNILTDDAKKGRYGSRQGKLHGFIRKWPYSLAPDCFLDAHSTRT